MTQPQPAEPWFQAVMGAPEPTVVADHLYKKVNEVLDERIRSHKERFAQEGTSDFDSIRFVVASQYLVANVDPGLVAGLAIAAIYRLARQ